MTEPNSFEMENPFSAVNQEPEPASEPASEPEASHAPTEETVDPSVQAQIDATRALTHAVYQLSDNKQDTSQEEQFDPENYWLIDESDPSAQSAELHHRISDYMSHQMEPLRRQLEQLAGATYLLQKSKADNSDFTGVRDEALGLLSSGKVSDFETAEELVRLRKSSTGGSVAPSTPNRAPMKPVPPSTASSPAARQGTSAPGPRERSGITSPRDIIQTLRAEGKIFGGR